MSEEKPIFCENPYDIEALVNALSTTSEHNADYILLDRIITELRNDPDADLIRVIFETMSELGFMQNQLKELLHAKG